MNELLSKSFLDREQLVMTYARAVCDSVLAVSSQLPYMSKVFFFATLDKLANVLKRLGKFNDETEAFKHLIDASFLDGPLLTFLQSVPGAIGTHLCNVVTSVSDELKIQQLSPDDIRDLRNSHHGYHLRPETVRRLYGRSGELNNDVTLLATPLVLWCLSEPWN